jgi:hypothetical protein
MFQIWKAISLSSSHHGYEESQVVWPCGLQLYPYHAYKIFVVCDAITLTFDLEKQYNFFSYQDD